MSSEAVACTFEYRAAGEHRFLVARDVPGAAEPFDLFDAAACAREQMPEQGLEIVSDSILWGAKQEDLVDDVREAVLSTPEDAELVARMVVLYVKATAKKYGRIPDANDLAIVTMSMIEAAPAVREHFETELAPS